MSMEMVKGAIKIIHNRFNNVHLAYTKQQQQITGVKYTCITIDKTARQSEMVGVHGGEVEGEILAPQHYREGH